MGVPESSRAAGPRGEGATFDVVSSLIVCEYRGPRLSNYMCSS